jgi:hypothetical protein
MYSTSCSQRWTTANRPGSRREMVWARTTGPHLCPIRSHPIEGGTAGAPVGEITDQFAEQPGLIGIVDSFLMLAAPRLGENPPPRKVVYVDLALHHLAEFVGQLIRPATQLIGDREDGVEPVFPTRCFAIESLLSCCSYSRAPTVGQQTHKHIPRARAPARPRELDFGSVVHLSRSPHRGLAVGIGAFGRAVWAQRESYCAVGEAEVTEVGIRHRWSFWRTRAPGDIADPAITELHRPASGSRGDRCQAASLVRQHCGRRAVPSVPCLS